jgi:hypothetical protein
MARRWLRDRFAPALEEHLTVKPRWGTPFWAENIAWPSVERVEADAMIGLGQGPFAATEQTDFEVMAILRDLLPDPE